MMKSQKIMSFVPLLLLMITAVPVANATGAENEDIWYTNQGNRSAINPYFDPDESCIIDIFQDKCDPGTKGECPVGFGRNEDGLCTHRTLVDGEWRWLCPEGYHEAWEDESGQCFPNDEGYQDDGYFLVEIEDEDRNDQCGPLYTICDEEEVRNEDYCVKWRDQRNEQ